MGLNGHPKKEKALSNTNHPKMDPNRPVVYQIRIKGHLGCEWAEWFEGLSMTQEKDGDTLLTGLVIDQSALHGLLKKIRDLGMPLVSVCPIEPDQTVGTNIRS